jgi:competence protein ComGF
MLVDLLLLAALHCTVHCVSICTQQQEQHHDQQQQDEALMFPSDSEAEVREHTAVLQAEVSQLRAALCDANARLAGDADKHLREVNKLHDKARTSNGRVTNSDL